MDYDPYIISIAGESGVGKSTISGIISLFCGAENTLSISSDDLHKWERSNPAWLSITHLNPDANNLELGDINLRDLSEGKTVWRSTYNHTTGDFNQSQKIEPKQIIINEGLHAFYTKESQRLSELKIFVDTDERLRTHWKIIRDREERGYTQKEILATIEKRKKDSEHIRKIQIAVADVIIHITPQSEIINLGDENELVTISISTQYTKNNRSDTLLEFVSEYMSNFSEFIKASEIIGRDINMCQNGGGNISVKTNSFMTIKASGFNMKDVHRLGGYSVVEHAKFAKTNIQNDHDLSDLLNAFTGRYKRPSMETGMHVLLKKYVLHSHPIYITLLLCLEDSQNIIADLFYDFDYTYIPYRNPGYELFDAFKTLNESDIFFLENHGVCVSGDEIEKATKLLFSINEISKNYIASKCDFKPFDISFANYTTESTHPFPDSVMFLNDPKKAETIAAHNYINTFGNKIGCVRYITNDDINVLKGLESEKYRQTIREEK